jgi:hypothetical protein
MLYLTFSFLEEITLDYFNLFWPLSPSHNSFATISASIKAEKRFIAQPAAVD